MKNSSEYIRAVDLFERRIQKYSKLIDTKGPSDNLCYQLELAKIDKQLYELAADLTLEDLRLIRGPLYWNHIQGRGELYEKTVLKDLILDYKELFKK